MRLVQVSIVMASLSLGVAVMLYLKVDRLERDLGNTRSRDVRSAEVGAMTEGGRYELAARAPEVEARPAGTDATARNASGGGPSARGAAATIEERIARLEEQQKALDAGSSVPWRGHAQAFASSVDDLSQRLSLTPTQRSRIEDAVARGRQRIEDVLKIPDETGKSPFERRTEARQKLEEAMKNPQPGGILAFATDLASYQGRKIPGRNDTYGDEIRRIRKETREEIASALDAKQQEAFAQTNVDGLLGEAGQVSFAVALGDRGGEGPSAGMVIEMDSSDPTETSTFEAPEPSPSGNK